MVRSSSLLTLAFMFLGACSERYSEPIKLTPHGDAVRQNMAAQIISPVPSAHPPGSSDAARAVLGVEAYRTGEVKDPTAQSTAPNTTNLQ